MTAPMLFALLLVFAAGVGLGWLGHGARAGQRAAVAEARLGALRDNEQVLRQSLSAASEDAARRNSQAIGGLVEPLREAVGALNQHIRQVEHNRINAYSGLREQVAGMQRMSHQLSTQTSQLVSALRAPQVRGRWGEIQLERVVELAGMSRHCDFDTQVSRSGPDGGVRPDLVVRLAGGRQIVVDAKVPLTAYLDATAEEDPRLRGDHLTRHAKHLRAHIDQLADKAYWTAFDPSPEFVVLFVPGDPFLDAALNADSGLLEYGFARNVILATPTTLIALLRTVAYGWRQEALSREVATIQQLARELYARLGATGRHLDRLGGQLGKAVDAFNHTVATMESRVLVTARRLHELEIGEREVPAIPPVQTWPRAVGFADTSD
ncbi:DNA recombination protein RmuC [Nocardia terpenica]|uniref:DNA recombination protein RmuC n=1 Tax=Nocardia terpenica TaxID=455432 RepID=UPI001893A8EF|nr:DNA recombination protein RmuC [Nocardia terpenica]MBF6060773.1 DNA recombination protein RmuC [Nocardia terpenica]MBF6104033.1 DNA recombination protein RmuC [Nocardia terpenica]MBF6111593.1 DNA recombination protein RmuC [Nocardia terpenica]MBF6118254.1 DNA recombination protein RmuC [Nocardia terpenica]MBF6156121.1 DNA recombination protein RmuC [Nocardia terpenica]